MNNCLLMMKPLHREILFTPGGKLVQNETLREGLCRELSEELPQVDCSIQRFLGRIEHRWQMPGKPQVSSLHYFFLVQAQGLTPDSTPYLNEPGFEFKWIDIYSANLTHVKPPSLISMVRSLSAQKDTVWHAVDVE